MRSSRSRVDTIPLIAGRPVLDLVNTVSWRGQSARSEDHLHDAGDCLLWACRVGVFSRKEAEELGRRLDQDPHAAGTLVAGLRLLRSVVDQAITPPATAPIERVEPLIREALDHSHLTAPDVGDHGSYHWQVSALDEHALRRRLSLDLLDLLGTTHGRIGTCADTACQWVFLDTSRAQNRQWCSSEDCGNRHRVRRHQTAARRSP